MVLAALVPLLGLAQEKTETRELVGTLGSRSALLVLHAMQRPDGGWDLTGEYILLPNLSRRFLEGERSPQLGVTTLREGTSAILFGRAPTGELRGTYRDGVFRGTRLGPGGQERERFEFSEAFPPMNAYDARVRCEAEGARYASSLDYVVDAAKPAASALEWRSRVAPDAHQCALTLRGHEVISGAVRFSGDGCKVTLRDLGEGIKVAAENCAAYCGSGAWLEPILVERRDRCRLLRAEPR